MLCKNCGRPIVHTHDPVEDRWTHEDGTWFCDPDSNEDWDEAEPGKEKQYPYRRIKDA